MKKPFPLLLPLLALVLPLCMACAGTGGFNRSTRGPYADHLEFDNPSLDDALQVTAYRLAPATSTSPARATLTLLSSYHTTLVLEARFLWFDAAGHPVTPPQSTPWHTVTLQPGTPKVLRTPAPAHAAHTPRLQLRAGTKSWLI